MVHHQQTTSAERRLRGIMLLFAAMLVFKGVGVSHANETDQFTIPVDADFVDLGDYFTLAHYHVLEDVVEDINARIDRAHQIERPAIRRAAINRLRSPGHLADQVRIRFGAGFFETLEIENILHSGRARRHAPDAIMAYRNPNWVYHLAHWPFDPRNLMLLLPSSTVQVYDVYIGTDKIGHFHDLGHIYFKSYLDKLQAGRSETQARQKVVEFYSRGMISESALIGRFATGVHSNADLAANYLGMLFYRNLTEPVMLKGRQYPPLTVQHGDYIRLNFHVRPESDFMRPFFSDHMNEALNPCVYEWGLRQSIARRLKKEAEHIRQVYTDASGNPRTHQWFEQRHAELVTYYGVDYGHTGILDDVMVTIANTCFTEHRDQPTPHEDGETQTPPVRLSRNPVVAEAADEH